MKNNVTLEVLVSLSLVALSILLLNPSHFWMPTMVHMVVLACTLVILALFMTFILQEKVQDEREAVNRMLSGRFAFLTGSALLTIGIVVQSLQDTVDVWLVIVLVVMVLSKQAVRMYSDTV